MKHLVELRGEHLAIWEILEFKKFYICLCKWRSFQLYYFHSSHSKGEFNKIDYHNPDFDSNQGQSNLQVVELICIVKIKYPKLTLKRQNLSEINFKQIISKAADSLSIKWWVQKINYLKSGISILIKDQSSGGIESAL